MPMQNISCCFDVNIKHGKL